MAAHAMLCGMGGEFAAFDRAEAASLIGWWLDAGVDVAITEEPRDWLKTKPVPTPAVADRDTIATGLENQGCFPELERGPTRPGRNNTGTIYRIESSIRCAANGAGRAEARTAEAGREP